ncbi:MAG TPA: hypothetical protein VGO48_07300 [Conexibacter sp.]|jgi:hypothetical protein|nr:hypothetical protein [Conexibacter sp.]
MASAASEAAVASHRGKSRAAARSTQDAATAAWLCAIPCAAIVATAILLLGPPLGDLLGRSRADFTFFPSSAAGAYDESTEHARYLIALAGPILLALTTRWVYRRQPPLPPRVVELAAPIGQLAFVVLLIACFVAQYRLHYGATYTRVVGVAIRERYFNPATLVAAAAIAGTLLLAARSAAVRTRAAALLRESPGRRWGALAAAVLLTAVWLTHAINTEESIGSVLEAVRYHLGFTLDETYAVLNGRTPLVDFSSQYSALWPLVTALVMHGVGGDSLLVFTLTMCALTSLALLAIYGVLRRVTRTSLAALLLYVPFLATSLFSIGAATVNRGSFANYFGVFPLRYAGPYLVAWLTARQIERGYGRMTGLWLLFAAGGLALVNNADFGAAAVGASVAAVVWTMDDRRSARTLAGGLAAGLATAVALVSLLTLARAGSLPQLDRVVDYARIYGAGGYAMLPLPGTLGLHTAIYLTYVATIGVATARALRGATNRVLTGMLAWAGIFGLGSATYYVGRSQPEALRTTFSVWALAIVLLTYVALRMLARRPPLRSSIGAVTVLVGFGIAVCSVVQIPAPWSQLDRIQAGFVPQPDSRYRHPLAPPTDPRTRTFVSSLADGPSRFVVRRGAPVAVLITTGHRVADAYGIVDVSPYTGVDSIHTVQQVDAVLAALRSAGGNTIIVPTRADPGIVEELGRRGFALATPSGLRPYDARRGLAGATQLPWYGESVVKMVDMRHLQPLALE